MDYRNDAAFCEAIRSLIALGHVLIHLKYHYYQGFIRAYGADPHISRLCQVYFYPTWFGGSFSAATWTWFNSQTRTNNNVESFHCAIKKFFAAPHMTFYKFSTILLQYGQSVAYDHEVRVAAGNPPPRVNYRYNRVAKSFETFHRNIMQYNPVQYLRGVANLVVAPLKM